jgi:hypothetical protein
LTVKESFKQAASTQSASVWSILGVINFGHGKSSQVENTTDFSQANWDDKHCTVEIGPIKSAIPNLIGLVATKTLALDQKDASLMASEMSEIITNMPDELRGSLATAVSAYNEATDDNGRKTAADKITSVMNDLKTQVDGALKPELKMSSFGTSIRPRPMFGTLGPQAARAIRSAAQRFKPVWVANRATFFTGLASAEAYNVLRGDLQGTLTANLLRNLRLPPPTPTEAVAAADSSALLAERMMLLLE